MNSLVRRLAGFDCNNFSSKVQTALRPVIASHKLNQDLQVREAKPARKCGQNETSTQPPFPQNAINYVQSFSSKQVNLKPLMPTTAKQFNKDLECYK